MIEIVRYQRVDDEVFVVATMLMLLLLLMMMMKKQILIILHCLLIGRSLLRRRLTVKPAGRCGHLTAERRKQAETEVLGAQSQQRRMSAGVRQTADRRRAHWTPRVVGDHPVRRVMPLRWLGHAAGLLYMYQQPATT